MKYYLAKVLCILYYLNYAFTFKPSPSEEINVPVFEPFPSAIIDPLLLCQGGLTSSIVVFSNKNYQFVAISLTICGVYIYDITNLENLVLTFSHSLNFGNTLGISYSQSEKIVWASNSNGEYYGIDVSGFPFKIKIQGVSQGNLLINQINPWKMNESILFILCNEEFQIFDWRQKDQGLVYMKSVNVNGISSKKIQFVLNNKYAIVTVPNKGIQFYQVQNGDDIDKMTFTYSCVIKPSYLDVKDFAWIDDQTIVIAMLYQGLSMYDMTNYFAKNGDSCTPASFKRLLNSPIQGLGGNLYLTKNLRYLFCQYRVIGAKIFDLSQKTFQIVQVINIENNSKDLALNEEEDLLFYSNSLAVQIFKKTKPNFNRDIPNLLLNTYQLAEYNFFLEDPIAGSLNYQCIWKDNEQSVLLTRANVGVTVLKYSGGGILEPNSSVYSQNSAIATIDVQFLKDGKIGYLVRQAAGLSIVDFSEPSNPIILKENLTFNTAFTFNNYLSFYDDDKKCLVSNTINVLIVNTEDPLNPYLLGVIDTLKYTVGEISAARIAVTKSGNWAFIGINLYGVVVANISDPTKPQPVFKMFTDGVAEIKLTQDEKHCILGANYQGLIITSINPKGELTIISKIKVLGTVYRFTLMKNDQYVLIASYENPAITIVSLKDINNPRQIQIFHNLNAISYSSFCFSEDETQFFVVTLFQLLQFTISSQIIIHTQIYQLISQDNSSEYTKKVLDQSQPLKVGQQIEMHLVPIYQQNGISIHRAFYYEQFILQELPSWMTFYPTNQILRLNISKDSLKKNDQGYQDNIQQVVFLTFQQIKNFSFSNTYLGITTNDSLSIFNACITEGIIDHDGYIQPQYQSNKIVSFGNNESIVLAKWVGPKYNLVKRFITYTLNQNIINYTIQFQIENSLIVNFNNESEIIKSIQNYVDLQMIVYKKQSEDTYLQSNNLKFVDRNYSGVLMLLSDKQDEIKFSGSKKNINRILQEGIKYFINEQSVNKDKMYIKIIVSDGVNYNYEDIFFYTSLRFLSSQSQIILSKSNSMQSEINSKYEDGQLYIQESFQYQIGLDIFTSVDEKTLKYSAQIKIGDQYRDIPKSYWLQFSSSDRSFSGIPLASNFNDIIRIQVNVTDGYNYQVDTFSISPSRIPFNYAIQLTIQILGPLFGIIGLYKHRSFIYNISFKEQYTYSREVIYVGEEYKKQITVTDNIRKAAYQLWILFLKDVGEKELKDQLHKEIQRLQLMKCKITSLQGQFKNQLATQSDIYGEFDLEIIKKKYNIEITIKDYNTIFGEQIKKARKNINMQEIDEKNIEALGKSSQINSQRPQEREKNEGLIVNNKQFTNSSFNDTKITKSGSYNKMKSLSKSIQHSIVQQKKEKSIFKNAIKENFFLIFDQSGSINIESILKFIKQRQLNQPEKQRIANTMLLTELNNVNSSISQAIYCFLVEFLLNQDRTTKLTFEALKLLAIKHYKEIDWYKAYVNIEPQFQSVNENPYSKITICRGTLDSALQQITQNIYLRKNQSFSESQQIDFSLSLIEENLRAKAIGYSIKSPKFLQCTQGESLHTYRHMIHSVQAHEKNKSIRCCFNLHKKLNLEYQQMSLIENNKLPSWIKGVDLINGAIIFGGVPEQKDIGIIVIKIIDKNGYILRSFELQILQRKQEQQGIIKQIENSNLLEVNKSQEEKEELIISQHNYNLSKNENPLKNEYTKSQLTYQQPQLKQQYNIEGNNPTQKTIYTLDDEIITDNQDQFLQNRFRLQTYENFKKLSNINKSDLFKQRIERFNMTNYDEEKPKIISDNKYVSRPNQDDDNISMMTD